MNSQDSLVTLEMAEPEPKERRRTWLWILLALLLLCIVGGTGVAIGVTANAATPTITPAPPTEIQSFVTLPPTDQPPQSTCGGDLADGICCAEAGESYLNSPGECACIANPTDGVCCTMQGESYPTDPGCPPPPTEGCTADAGDGLCCTMAGETYPGEPACEPSCIANPADGICCAEAGETYLTSPSECACIANPTDGMCCTLAGETHDIDPNECRGSNDPCAGHGGLQWQGQLCGCDGKVDVVIVCMDGSKSDTITVELCTPDPAQCRPPDPSTGGGTNGGGSCPDPGPYCSCNWITGERSCYDGCGSIISQTPGVCIVP